MKTTTADKLHIVKVSHSNMYEELLPEIAKTSWDLDTYEMMDTNVTHTGDGVSDTLNTIEATYAIDEGHTDVYKCMEDYIDYMRCAEDEGELDKQTKETLNKVCTAYAASFSKQGGPLSDKDRIGLMSDNDQERFDYVMKTMDEISDGKFKTFANDMLSITDTVRQMRHVLSYSNMLIADKYPDLKTAPSVQAYQNAVDTYKEARMREKMSYTENVEIGFATKIATKDTQMG